MSNLVPMNEISSMAKALAGSGLFGVKNETQAMALMLVAQSEGKHPASIAQDYDIIQGRPALKSQAMLARFQQSGGRVDWTSITDEKVSAVFSHPNGGSVEIDWDTNRAKQAGLNLSKDNWKKYPRAMLRARVISEGVRTCFPACCNGHYTPEEVQDFEEKPVQAQVVESKPQELGEPPASKECREYFGNKLNESDSEEVRARGLAFCNQDDVTRTDLINFLKDHGLS